VGGARENDSTERVDSECGMRSACGKRKFVSGAIHGVAGVCPRPPASAQTLFERSEKRVEVEAK